MEKGENWKKKSINIYDCTHSLAQFLEGDTDDLYLCIMHL